MWYQNRPQLQTGQFPLTQRVSSQWPRFNQLRDGQKLPKNRLWRICINTNCENQNDWLDYWSGRKINKKIKKKLKKLKLPGRLLVRPWPDQPDRLLRPCVVYPVDTIVTVICFYTMLCICDTYLLCLVCIGFAYIIYILQDTYNTLFFNNPDNPILVYEIRIPGIP